MLVFYGIYMKKGVIAINSLYRSPPLASVQSTGAQSIESQEQVQHENAKTPRLLFDIPVMWSAHSTDDLPIDTNDEQANSRYNRQGREATGVGTTTSTDATREHKSTQYRDLQPTSAPNASNNCDQRPLLR